MKKKQPNAIKKRWGDRREGRRLRTLEPINLALPFLMPTRVEAQNKFADSIEISEMWSYVHKKRREGFPNLNAMHIIVAAYTRTIAEFPGVNRFISGYRIFARHDVEVCMAVKKEMKINAPESMLKFHLKQDYTLEQVYQVMNDEIEKYKSAAEDNSFDGYTRFLCYFPRFLFKLAVKALYFLDYFDWLPKSVLELSPFHCSFLITSMGSLGVKPIYHHLYNLGNAPMFISFGLSPKDKYISHDDSIKERRFMELKFNMDERICDGQYFATAVHALENYIRHPELLETPPEQVNWDVD